MATRDSPRQHPDSKPKVTLHLMPHQHFDHAWYEPIKKCNLVAGKNLRDALLIMRSSPDYTFVLDQGVLVESFARNFPEMVPELKLRVKEGRMGLACGMVTMPDSVLPSAENHIRNIVYGKKFFYDFFGEEVIDGWMLDVFGQTMQIPQIFGKAGLRSTTFFRGFDYTRPHDLDFLWQAPDGTKILAHVFPSTALNIGYTMFMAPMFLEAVVFSSADRARAPLITPIVNFQARLPQEKLRAYVSMLRKINTHLKHAPTPHLMFLNGSDFTRPLPALPSVARFVKKKGRTKFDLKFSTPRAFFDEIEKYQNGLEVREGEFMRPEVILHGTYSTRAYTKQLIRKMENLLYQVELITTLGHILLGIDYPHDQLHDRWHALFENDFHDIICGCNSDIVYLESTRQLKTEIQLLQKMLAAGEEHIVNHIEISPDIQNPVWIFNPHPWAVGGMLRIPLPRELLKLDGTASRGSSYALEIEGQLCPCETLGDGYITVVVPPIQGIGWKVGQILNNQDKLSTGGDLSATEDTETGEIVLENQFYRLVFTNDAWVKCIDKNAGVNLIAPGNRDFGRVIINPEKGDTYFTVIKYKRINPVATQIALVHVGPVSSTVEIKEKYRRRGRKATTTTSISLTAGVKRVDIQVKIVNRMKRVLYRLALPFNLQTHTTRVVTGVPGGHIQRPNGRSPAVQWATLEGKTTTDDENAVGIALFDEGIPAREFRGNVAYFALLRSVGVLGKIIGMPFVAAFPYGTKGAYEQGTYQFHCGFSSQSGSFTPEKAAREGLEFNLPLTSRPLAKNKSKGPEERNSLPPVCPLISSEENVQNFVSMALKVAEPRVIGDRAVGSGLIFRLLETSGAQVPTPVSFRFDPLLRVKFVEKTNLLEESESKLDITGGKITVPLKTQEILSINIRE